MRLLSRLEDERKCGAIWYEISRFGLPYPPFDYRSGMRVRNVDRKTAEALGIISADETVEPMQAPALEREVPLRNLSPDALAGIMGTLGDAVQIAGEVIKLVRAIA